MSIYSFQAKTIDGEEITLDKYKGKVLLVVNTASKCGFTPQYEGLEKLYEKYKDQGLEILGFPCNQFAEQEPGDNQAVKNFCQANYGVSFQIFEKTDVRGETAHPLFNYLTEEKPFEGFNMKHPIGETLYNALKTNMPTYLEGDSVKWNFTKFLVDRDGNVSERFEPTSEPLEMEEAIKKLI